MSDTINTQAVEFRPTLAMRIWKRLGFRYGAYAGRPDDDNAIYTVHCIFTHWDWRDRLRILVSGQTEIEMCIETEALEKLKGVRQQAIVLVPGAHFSSGVPRHLGVGLCVEGNLMQDGNISIAGLDKAQVLCALYNNARPQGIGILAFETRDMSLDEAKELLKTQSYFDYVKGRVMKVRIEGDTLSPRLYDRDNGPGAAADAIETLRR